MPGERVKASKFMQRCVADVVGQGKDREAAFAICTAQSQKSGYSEPGSRKLTGKGKEREKQFAGKRDMADKKQAYLAATGRAEEAMDEFTWKKILPAVTQIMARNQMNDWGKPTGPYAVFAARSGAAFVTLIDVRRTGGAGGDHEGQFTVVAGIPEGYDWSDLGREERETREIVKEARKASIAAVQRLAGPLEDEFEVRKFGTMVDLLGWREEGDRSTRLRTRFHAGEARTVRGLLARLEEAKQKKIQVTAFVSLRTGFMQEKQARFSPGQQAAFKKWVDGLKGDPGATGIELLVAGKPQRYADVVTMLGEAEDGPDVKAIAHEILRQLGGRRFLAMTGAKDLVHAPTLDAERPWPTLSMKLPIGNAKVLRIALAPDDTYTVQFSTKSGRVIDEVDRVYADSLQLVVGRGTGLALSL